MALSTTVQFRTSSSVKAGAFAVFEKMGISPSAAMQLFLQQVQKTNTLPFIITANSATDDKEEGYDAWLSARLEDTIKKLDSGEMRSAPLEEVRARLQIKRAERRTKHSASA